MNIVISTHFDIARPVMSIKLTQDKLVGLVDNLAGVFATYQAARKTGTEVYFTNFEELYYDGALDVGAKLDKEKTIVVVVDTIKASDAGGKSASFGNFYGIDPAELKEKLGESAHFIDGYFEEHLDESYVYGKKYGFKSFYFGVPIEGEDYHDTNNHANLKTIDEASEILVETINWLKEKYK